MADFVPRGLRNNNPGNIEDGPFARSMPGYVGSDGRFARFASLDQGYGAMSGLFGRYGNMGINSVNGVVNRWAPSSDGNNTKAYAGFVAKQLGVSPDDSINMYDPATKMKLAKAMAAYENGTGVPPAAGGPDPTVYGPPSGAPQSGPPVGQMPNDWSTPLQQAGAALASINNPGAGMAIGQLASQRLQQQRLQQEMMQPHTIGQDMYGQPIYGIVTPNGIRRIDQNGQILPQGSASPDPMEAAVGNMDQPFFQKVAEANRTGGRDAALGLVDPAVRPELKAMIEGRASAAMLGRQGPFRNKMISLAQAVDPTFDENVYKERAKMWGELGSSASNTIGGQAASLEKLTRHEEEVRQAQAGLSQDDLKIVNGVKNWLTDKTGSPALNRYRTAVTNYTEEASRFLKQGPNSDANIKIMNQPFDPSNSPSQFRAALSTNAKMFRDQYQGIEDRWTRQMNMPVPGGHFISDTARGLLDQHAALDRPPSAAGSEGGGGPRIVAINGQPYGSSVQASVPAPAGGATAPVATAPVAAAPAVPEAPKEAPLPPGVSKTERDHWRMLLKVGKALKRAVTPPGSVRQGQGVYDSTLSQ